MAVAKLKGSALAWWRPLINRRLRMGKALIEDWNEMKYEIRRAFLPHRYMQQLHAKWLRIRQGNMTLERILLTPLKG